jgi:organic hydroperoxide reductase OsmC/OhrA
MKISASLQNEGIQHQVTLATEDRVHSITIPARPDGQGSSANGGELLFLALATCYCNDIYREARGRGIKVERVEVSVEGSFGAPGEPASGVSYRAKVTARASEEDIRELVQAADRLAEIQNTVRAAIPVKLSGFEVVSLPQ